MKVIGFVLTSFFFFWMAQGLYVGNPACPAIIEDGFFISKESLFSIKTGYQGDYVFDSKLKARSGADGRIDRFEYIMNQGVVTLNLLDKYEAYASVGAMNLNISHRPHIDLKRREYETSDHLTWGVGARWMVFQWTDTVLGVGGAFQLSKPHVKWNALDGEAFTTGAEATFQAWQVDLALAYCGDIFNPYLAITYSDVHAKLRDIRENMLLNSSFQMTSRNHVGLALGCSLSKGDFFDLTVETRLFDEQALTLAGNVKF